MATERPLSVDVIALTQERVIRPAIFIYADFPSQVKRIWTGNGPVEFRGETWDGIGEVLSIESIRETADTSAQGLACKIAAVPDEVIDMLVNDEYQGRDVEIWLALWDESEQVLYSMEQPLWAGFLDSDDVEASKESRTVTIRAEHDLVDILRSRAVKYTDMDQKYLYPTETDTGLNKIAAIQDKQAPWGRKVV
jgi:hypothetical protein